MSNHRYGLMLPISITRRQLLGGSSAAVAASLVGFAPTRGRAAMSGTANVFCSAGQRWELPQRAVLPLFSKAFPNIKINLQPVPHGEAVTKIMVSMSSKTDAYDVVFTDNGQWPALNAMGAMTELGPFMDKDPPWRDDYLADVPPAIANLYRVPAKTQAPLYGLTPDGNAQIAFYRTDLFQQKGMKLPETWPEVIDAAKELTDKAKGQYGFISTMRRGIFAGWQFWAVMASYGGSWFDKEETGGWRPQFATDPGYQALQTLLKLMPYAHPVTLNATDDEANSALADGSAVYGPIEWGTAVLNDSKFTKFADVIRADITPRGETAKGRHAPLMGGLGMFIPSWSKNKDAAWEWIKWCNSGDMTNPAIGEAWVKNSGQPARVSLLNKYTSIRPYFAGLSKAYPHAVPYMATIPEAQTIAELIGNETSSALTAEKSIEAALKGMDEGVTHIMSDSGYYH
jgi:ABC-type glycerol-3-phosphate transport system substrate-binding protein